MQKHKAQLTCADLKPNFVFKTIYPNILGTTTLIIHTKDNARTTVIVLSLVSLNTNRAIAALIAGSIKLIIELDLLA